MEGKTCQLGLPSLEYFKGSLGGTLRPQFITLDSPNSARAPQISARAHPGRGDARHIINERHLRNGVRDARDVLNERRARSREEGKVLPNLSQERREPQQQKKDSKEREQGSSISEPSKESEAQIGNLGFITPFSEGIMRAPNPRKVKIPTIKQYAVILGFRVVFKVEGWFNWRLELFSMWRGGLIDV